MVRVLLFLAAVTLVIQALAFIDCLSVRRDEFRGPPRPLWALLIMVFPLVGSAAWFGLGRVRRPFTSGTHPAGGSPSPARPPAPDDDPDFLAVLARRAAQQREAPETPDTRDLPETRERPETRETRGDRGAGSGPDNRGGRPT